MLYRKQGQYALAAPLYDRVLGIEESVQGGNSPVFAALADSIAQFYREAGDADHAAALAARAATIRAGLH